MRCHEAKVRLNSASPIDEELRKHLASCPACAKLASAEEILRKSFDESKSDIPETTPFAFVRARVEARSAQVNTSKERSIMSSFLNRIYAHPRVSIGLIAAVLLFAVVTLVPFSYSHTVGYKVTCSQAPAGVQASLGRVTQALGALGFGGANVNANPDKGIVELTGFSTEKQAREAGAAFAQVTGYAGTPAVTPIRQTVSGSIYAQLREQFFEVRVEVDNRTDAEIAAEITSKLQAAGLNDADVRVTTGTGGSRQINVTASSSSGAKSTITITADSTHK